MSILNDSPYPTPRDWPWHVGAVTLYLCMALSGAMVGAYLLAGNAKSAIEAVVLGAWAVGTFIPGLSCAYGVAFDKYRWEWVASGPLAAGVGVYAAFTWLSIGSVWQVANALIITAFTLFIAGRSRRLGEADRRARRDAVRRVVQGVTDG